MSVSVVIPTLNEAENIEGIIHRILAGAAGLDAELIVVDDGSKDDTQAIVRRLGSALPVRLLARVRPKDGLAGAVLAGARAASREVVLVIDADGSHPPEKIPALALPVIQGEKDMVIGSRYMPGGSTPGWSRKRRLMSRAASACAWPLTDVHDALSGFFAVRRELLASIPPDAAGFKIALEILVRGGDAIRVGEVPIAFRDRELGQSKMGTGVILTYFRRLLALSGWRDSPGTMGLAVAKTLLIWLVHWGFFACAWSWARSGLGMANLIGFLGGVTLNNYLKMRQHGAGAGRKRHFVFRLGLVSVLSFFLRSGILATFAGAFGWSALVAVVPAIVTGWFVMFLGYALFIWPERGQYGTGIRWRVAALGATAYLFALRLAYLYAVPVDPSLASAGHVDSHFHPFRLATLFLEKAGTALLGPSGAGFNLPAVVCWTLCAWCVFRTARRMFDKTVAFRALLLFSALPPFFIAGTMFTSQTASLVLWAFALMTVLSSGPVIFLAVALGFILWAPARLHGAMAPVIAGLAVYWSAAGLPALPWLAAGMEQPGKPPQRFWAPVIYLCILGYGAVFYRLAFRG